MENIYLPETIKVGYQKRGGTYNGKLAYIIYIDEKGKVRKETSWNSWRDEKIEPNDFKNEPTEGFVLNKKVGGYSSGWDHRQTYTRVFDPRGFEFEITVENLLYILENCSCIKGKGLEGQFVYGWQGTELILVPCASPDYEKLSSFSKQVQEYKQTKVKAKELIFGAVYRNKQNEDLVYMERMDEYCTWYGKIQNPKRYFFYNLKTSKFVTYASPSVLIGLTNATPVDNYADLMDTLLSDERVSPIDYTKDEFIDLNLDEVNEILNSNSYWSSIYGIYNSEPAYFQLDVTKKITPVKYEDFYSDEDEDWTDEQYELAEAAHTEALIQSANAKDIYTIKYVKTKADSGKYSDEIYCYYTTNAIKLEGTVEELHAKYNFKKLKQYLKNGNEKR